MEGGARCLLESWVKVADTDMLVVSMFTFKFCQTGDCALVSDSYDVMINSSV